MTLITRGWPFVAALWLLGALTAHAEPPEDTQGRDLIGKPAPDFRLKDASGREWRLSALKGQQVVVLDFGRTFCIGCRETVKDLQKIHQGYRGKNVSVFTVCTNAQELQTVRDFVQEFKLSYPVLRDVELKATKAYQVEMIPFTVIVNKKGVVHWVHTGHPDDYADLVRAQLAQLLAQP